GSTHRGKETRRMAEVGYVSVVAALMLALYGAIAGPVGVKLRWAPLVRTAQYVVPVQFVLVTAAALALVYALLANDFTMKYVVFNTTRATPFYYKITGLWGALEGSILLWEWILALFSILVVWRHRREDADLLPYVLSILLGVSAFFLSVAAFVASPFEPIFPAPADGRGLNPLLEDSNMLTHPPLLYSGFVGLTVPYAFAMAALIMGKVDARWIVATRKWTVIAWYFLTMGNLVGGWWSYHVLGWGGYWAWDPVENAAFLPWLPATAFLHSVMIQERRQTLKAWNLLLIILAFALTLFGTFLTRSGVLSSIHAFSNGPVGAYFLGFLGVVLTGSVGLLVWRAEHLKAPAELDAIVSRESAFLLNNLVLVGATFTIFFGTVFPLLMEAIQGVKVSVGAPYFNQVTVPIFLLLLAVMGVGPLLAWRKASLDQLRRNFLYPAMLAVAAGIAFLLGGVRELYPWLAFTLSVFVVVTIVFDFARSARGRQRMTGEDPLTALLMLFRKQQRRYGGFVVHFGVVLIILGIAASMTYSVEKEAVLQRGEGLQVGRYWVQFQGLSAAEMPTHTRVQGTFQAYIEGNPVATMAPAQKFFPSQQSPFSRAVLRTTLREDLYLILAGFQPDGSAVTVKALVRPMVVWMWIGGLVMSVGTLLVLWPYQRELARGRQRRPAQPSAALSAAERVYMGGGDA
ncbi:MAG: heme lyase CcmF/NrfE family subunit, partial [Candidatus Entotheonellia bacterium]